MKKYKLIKRYPSMYLNEVGFTVKQKVENGDYYPIKDCDRVLFKACEIENHPEFWEEVVDNNPLKLEIGKTYKIQYKHCLSSIETVTVTRFTKQGFPWSDDIKGIITDSYNLIEEVVKKDYEILTFKHNKTGCISSQTKNSLFLNDPNPCIEGFCKEKVNFLDDDWTLWSVKRVSDGEVFTVDKYVENTQYPQKHRSKINKFILDGNTVRVYYGFGWDRLEHVSNSKQVLLTTEDRVDIFEGDRIYWQSSMTGNIVDCTIHSKEDLLFSTEGRKFFSTKEAVEEFILMNKPCLSYEEIMEQIPFTDKDRKIQKNLKELVKSKLE